MLVWMSFVKQRMIYNTYEELKHPRIGDFELEELDL